MDQDLARGSNICTDAEGTPSTDPPIRKRRLPSAATDEEDETGTGGEGRGRGGHPGCGSKRKKRRDAEKGGRRERRMWESERRRTRRAARRGSGWRQRRAWNARETRARDGCAARGRSAMQWTARSSGSAGMRLPRISSGG
jgi:hypothetical protein